MTSALQPLASASSSTVLPVPKPPGIAALPPCATGNRQSRMRWPVTSGAMRRQPARDRPRHAHRPVVAHRRARASPPSATRSVQTVASSRVLARRGDRRSTSPPTSGGARTACARPLAAGRIADDRARRQHVARLARAARTRTGAASARRMPGCTKPESVPDSGRSRPSKMLPSRPGPERDRERQPGALDLDARPQAGRVLVDLHDDLVAVDADHFAQQRLRPDAHRLAQRERTLRRRRAAPGPLIQRIDGAAHSAGSSGLEQPQQLRADVGAIGEEPVAACRR